MERRRGRGWRGGRGGGGGGGRFGGRACVALKMRVDINGGVPNHSSSALSSAIKY